MMPPSVRVFWCFSSLCLILSATALAQHPEPVDPMAAMLVAPLPQTKDTTLRVTFDQAGQPVVQPAGLSATIVGTGEAMGGDQLPGFDNVVRMGVSGKKNGKALGSYLEVADGAKLLGQGAFTIDAILRFSLGDEHFLNAGPTPLFQMFLLDRDAGTFAVNVPDGKKGVSIGAPAVFEKVGPLGRDRFQLITLTYDGKGGFVFYIDGTEVFQGKAEGVTGPLPLDKGPLRLGGVTSYRSLFQGDIAELRVQNGVHPPEPVKVVAAPAKTFWGFDVTATGVPVAPGYQAVTEADVFADTKAFGWTAKPEGTADLWFVGERYAWKPEVVTKEGTRRARLWNLRDAVLLPSGEGFIAKLPPGRYVVTASIGRPDKSLAIAKVEANGSVIGKDMYTVTTTGYDSVDRTARGVAEVGADGKLTITATSMPDKDGALPSVGFMSFTAIPFGTLPVERDGDNLVWKGPGAAPAGFDKAAAAYAAKDWAGAFAAAGEIPDLFQRAATRAWIVGYPELTEKITLDWLDIIQADLTTYLRQHPADINARYLEDLTMRVWHAALAYVYQRPTSRVFGPTKGRAWREGLNLALEVFPGEPYYGHAHLLAANFMWQWGQQVGGYVDDNTWRNMTYHSGYPVPPPYVFREVLAAYPDATLPKVFLSNNVSLQENSKGDNSTKVDDGGRVPVAKVIPIPEGAPEWAALQHRIITRLVDIVNYWYENRMEENGTMGGGYGDDVEMMRWWKTSVLVADDEKAFDGWQRLAATGWQSMEGQPMPDKVSDAEHVAEDFGDSHGLQPLLHVGDDKFQMFLGRSRMLVPILTNVLMTRDGGGFLAFKAHDYSRLESRPPNGDVPYNLRTMLPLFVYAFFKPDDKEVSDIIIEYAKGWRDMTLKEVDGKPAGITPMLITLNRQSVKNPSNDGRLKKPTDWVFPGFWTYEYPAGYTSHVYDLFLAAYYLSGDASFLDPQKKALEFIKTVGPGQVNMTAATGSMTTTQNASGVGDYDYEKFPRGSLEWAVRINRAGLALAGAQYRAATGDKSFDDVLLMHGPAYTKFTILAERAKTPQELAEATKALNPMFENILSTLDYNEILRTRLPQSTDRVWVPGMDFLESTATGDISISPPPTLRGEEEFWPMFGVTWKKTGTDISMLVTKNAKDRLEVYLYNFLETPKQIGARVWQLAPGKYKAKLVASPDFQDGAVLAEKDFEVKAKGEQLDFDVPPRQQVHLVIESAK